MLTDSQCRSAKCKDKPYKLTDTNGLYLEVKPNGVKAWRYRFKLTKAGETKGSAFAIGDYASAPAGETADEAKARRAGRARVEARVRGRMAFPFTVAGRVGARVDPSPDYGCYCSHPLGSFGNCTGSRPQVCFRRG